MMIRTALLGLFATLPLARTASAQINYPNFMSTEGLTIVGKAATAQTPDGAVMRIVPDKPGKAGAFYLTNPFTLGANGAFTTQFQFHINGDIGNAWADGMTFFISRSPPTGLGMKRKEGGYLGYGGLKNSIAVEFDTYFDSGLDAERNEVAVDKNGNVATINHVKQSYGQPYGISNCGSLGPNPSGCLNDGQIWTVTISYNGAFINVTVQDGSNAQYKVVKELAVSVLGLVGSQSVYVGFSAATGAALANFDLLNWTLTN